MTKKVIIIDLEDGEDISEVLRNALGRREVSVRREAPSARELFARYAPSIGGGCGGSSCGISYGGCGSSFTPRYGGCGVGSCGYGGCGGAWGC